MSMKGTLYLYKANLPFDKAAANGIMIEWQWDEGSLQNGMIFVAGLKIHYFKYDQLKKVDLVFTKTDEKHYSAGVKIIDRGGRIYEKDFKKYFSSQRNEAFSQLMYGVKGDTVRQVSEYLEKSDVITVIINN